jgi:hypothetical protein
MHVIINYRSLILIQVEKVSGEKFNTCLLYFYMNTEQISKSINFKPRNLSEFSGIIKTYSIQ